MLITLDQQDHKYDDFISWACFGSASLDALANPNIFLLLFV